MLLVYHKTFILAPVLLLIHEPFMSLSLQARRNEKNSGGGGRGGEGGGEGGRADNSVILSATMVG